MHETSLVTYAYNKEGILVHVDTVERGHKCKCTCSKCGKELIARKGEKKKHHFAHSPGVECPQAYETSLHHLAKKVIKDGCFIQLPELVCETENRAKIFGRKNPNKKTYKFKPDRVEVEQAINDFIPDVLVYLKNSPLIVEIYVTHKVDDEKKQKIKNSEISAIQIDLSNIDREITEAEIKKLLESGSNTEWLYNKKINDENKITTNEKKYRIYFERENGKHYIEYPPCKGEMYYLGMPIKYTEKCEMCHDFCGLIDGEGLKPSYILCGRNANN